MGERPVVLLLGGTGQARALAAGLAAVPGLHVVTSLAGRVRTPRPVEGGLRTGGFGGADGLTAWVRTHAPAAVVDATHPFAVRISGHAQAASVHTGTPLLRLLRAGWSAGPADRWYRVSDVAAAAALASSLGARPLVTIGQQGLEVFAEAAKRAGLSLVVRCVEPPQVRLPTGTQIVLGRGPYTVDGETALLTRHRVDVLVTKDSGGAATAAKLEAARALAIPVIMVDRPAAPAPNPQAAHLVHTALTVAQAHHWVCRQLGRLDGPGHRSRPPAR